jgi:hypothetical protein
MLIKQKINNVISDMVADFLYYDRKEDEDLPVGKIEQAIINEEIKIQDIVDTFKIYLTESVENYIEEENNHDNN